MKGLAYAYRDRRARKGDMRKIPSIVHPTSPLPGYTSVLTRSVPRLARRGLNDHARFAGFGCFQFLKFALMGLQPGLRSFAPLGLNHRPTAARDKLQYVRRTTLVAFLGDTIQKGGG